VNPDTLDKQREKRAKYAEKMKQRKLKEGGVTSPKAGKKVKFNLPPKHK
jgi:hypothetical protein